MANRPKETFFKPENQIYDKKLPVRLVLCFDGTGDTEKGSRNVGDHRYSGTSDSICSIYTMSSGGPVTDSSGKRFFQIVKYFQGVATGGVDEHGWTAWFCDVVAGATGYGYLGILKAAYKLCCEKLQYERGDEIFIFGFSRGAFISRALASFLQHVGLLGSEFLGNEKAFQDKVNELLEKEYKWRSQYSYPEKLPASCKQSPRVRFLGAFDTVKAVYPMRVTNYFSGNPTVDFRMDAPHIVDHFRHVLALNEARPLFTPEPWRSDACSEDSSYQEAWFFGHHHDIGGGSYHAGLALWPLQWMLQAATDYGLVLDNTHKYYDTLFSGAKNIIQIPCTILMNMADMIQHHKPGGNFLLRLNKPSTYQLSHPRDYSESVRKTFGSLSPKTFLHPSVYLIFDVSASFRIQVQEWKFVRQFMNDRHESLQKGAPWWESHTVNEILTKTPAAKCLNILIYGRPGTGKSSLIGMGFGAGHTEKGTLLDRVTKSNHDINTPIKIEGNELVNIFYSHGFGSTGSDDCEEVVKFLEQHIGGSGIDSEDQIHAIWYFLDCSTTEISKAEERFLKLNFGEVPLHVILANENKLENGVLAKAKGVASHAYQSGSVVFNLLNKKPVDKPKSLVELRIEEVKKINSGVTSFVHTLDPNETLKNLAIESLASLPSHALLALIKAQRVLIKWSIALANETTLRAYTVWYTYRFKGQSFPFRRSVEYDKGLSWYLLEPILTTFNMRFDGDIEIIQSEIGHAWCLLDRHKSGLLDETVPGDLIVMCMVDTIIVMVFAHHHQKASSDVARPFIEDDIINACAWYKSKRQNEMHKTIKGWFSQEDYSPINGSISTLRMGLIAAVEFEAEVAENEGTWFWQRW